MSLRNKIMGVLTFLFALLILYATNYMVSTWSTLMPNTYLKSLFWIGYILIVASAVLIKPALLIFSDQDGSPIGVFLAAVSFMIGCLFSVVLDYMYDGLLIILGIQLGTYQTPTLIVDIFWFLYVILTLFAMIIVPMYSLIEEPLKVAGINTPESGETSG